MDPQKISESEMQERVHVLFEPLFEEFKASPAFAELQEKHLQLLRLRIGVPKAKAPWAGVALGMLTYIVNQLTTRRMVAASMFAAIAVGIGAAVLLSGPGNEGPPPVPGAIVGQRIVCKGLCDVRPPKEGRVPLFETSTDRPSTGAALRFPKDIFPEGPVWVAANTVASLSDDLVDEAGAPLPSEQFRAAVHPETGAVWGLVSVTANSVFESREDGTEAAIPGTEGVEVALFIAGLTPKAPAAIGAASAIEAVPIEPVPTKPPVIAVPNLTSHHFTVNIKDCQYGKCDLSRTVIRALSELKEEFDPSFNPSEDVLFLNPAESDIHINAIVGADKLLEGEELDRVKAGLPEGAIDGKIVAQLPSMLNHPGILVILPDNMSVENLQSEVLDGPEQAPQ